MRSSVTAAVAVMAGMGGGVASLDAMAATGTGGGLNLCLTDPVADGVRYGQTFGSTRNLTAANCAPINSSLPSYQGHTASFILANNANVDGSASPTAPTASVMGSTDGHLVMYGKSGVHIIGSADFDNNVNMTNHRITGLAAGTAGTDAVNVNQLNAAISGTGASPYVKINSSSNAAAATGDNAVAIGQTVTSAGSSSIAMGSDTTASGLHSIALGASAKNVGTADRQIAIGSVAQTSGQYATAVGYMASAAGADAMAFGRASSATTGGALSIGTVATSSGTGSIALGNGAVAKSGSGGNIAIGQSAIADAGAGVGATAIGTSARAGTPGYAGATAIGLEAQANYGNAALGRGAQAIGSAASVELYRGVLAIGDTATATAGSSVALGYNSLSDRANSVSVGRTGAERQIVNVAAGTQGTDAVNLNQLNAAIADVSTGENPYVAVRGTTAANATGARTIAIGDGAVAASTYGAGSGGDTNIAIGANARTTGGFGEMALGEGAAVTMQAVGATAIGHGATAQANRSVALGEGALADRANTVSVGSATLRRQITNVAAGTQDNDAVNVSQLKGAGLIGDDGKSIAAVTYDRNTDGTPNYGAVTLGNGAGPTQLKNVADATDDHDALNLGQLKNSGLVGDDGAGNLTSMAVTYDNAAKDRVTLDGAAGTTLSNVKAGVADLDAVNVSQLKGAGLIDPATGQPIAAVTYDRHADGTPNYNSVTMGGGKATGPVTVSNVAAGVAATDAVNVQQMQRAVVEGNPYIGGRGTGVAARATGINAVALGLGSVANEINTISVGNGATGLQRRITNVQNGEADSDAATVGQVNDLIGVASTSATSAINDIDAKTRVAIQDMNSRLDSINTTASADPYVQVDGAGDGSDNAFAGAGTVGVAIGAEASATGTTAIAVGAQSVSSGTGSVALGAGASATATGAVAFGSGRATGTSALALGNGTAASGNNAVAAGFNAQASGLNGLALGNTSRANATDSMAFGTAAQVDRMATNSIAIGRDANVTSVAQNSVALGSGSAADRLNSISIGSTGQQRQIIYVARGTADTDAVNVSQLKDAMSSFGGTAAVGADGSIVNPTYSIGGKTYRNVGDALNALAALGGGGADPLAVTYGTDAGGAPNFEIVTLRGADGTTLSNVKAGVADMDAVNVSQLKGSGLIGDDGKSIAAVTYDRNADGTPNYGSATLGHGEGPTQLKNVADATDDGDALNLGQLKDAGLVGDDGAGNLTSLAVTYDGAAKDSVTLGGAGATTPVALHNVADGVLSADSKDAVNGSQLFATNTRVGDLEDSLSKGGVIDPVTGESLAVVYDSNAKDTVTLKGADGTTLSNVKAGVADMDAVNVSQLKGSGLIGDDGKSIAAVTYDRNADGTPNYGSVTLGNGAGPTQLKNVADATDDGDALNLGQLKDAGLVGDDGAGNLTSMAVTYDGAAKDKVTLAGTDGTTLSNVKAGVADMDAVNVSQLKGSGLIGDDGKSIAAVTYDRNADGTPNYGSVTLGHGEGPTQLKNVADATDDGDALNLGQLKDAGLVGDDGAGNLTSMAVTYDGAAKDSVTLGGAGATTPVALHNVADGVLSADSKDAVNGSQLFATNTRVGDLEDSLSKGGVIDPVTGESLAVVYDSNAKDTVTLKGADGTTLSNVKAGVADMDAVNVSQLKGSGLIGDDGKSIAAVTYDRNADGTPNYGSVTLGAGKSTGPVTLSNVAEGVAGTDAVNVDQMVDYVAKNGGGTGNPLAVAYDSDTKDTITLQGADGTALTNVKAGAVTATSTDAVNGAQLHGVSQSVADALGGGSTVGADGSVTNPTYSLADPTDASKQAEYSNVGDALSNLDGRTTTNTKNITVINQQLADSGLVDPVTGQSIAAVTYDRNADGTANRGSVTLGGAGATAPVALKNVADGVDTHDAVNLGQLQSAGLVAPVDPTDPEAGVTSLAMTYDKNADGTANFSHATLKGADGTTLSNVKAGVADMDAVNVSQLKGSGLIGDDGKSIAAVTYDRHADGTPNYGSVTFGDGTNPTQLKHVADATDDGDALNLGQLKSAGLVGDDGKGALTSLAMTYDKNADGTANFGSATLKGADGTTLSNVKAGVADMDAVNVSQLKGSGLIGEDGKSIAAVTYDRHADGTPNLGSVTLGGAGATAPVALKNVADGTERHDAINLGQLQDAGLVAPVDPINPGAGLTSLAVTYDKHADDSANLGQITLKGADGTTLTNVKAGAVTATSTDAVNGAQLHGVAQSVADSLGGGSTVDENGNVTNPTYSLADPTDASKQAEYSNVGDALSNLDGRTTTNTKNITVINQQLADSGLVDPVTGQSIAAVTYDRNADGTANRGSVTLGGAGATAPVALKNVADGVDTHDAVNLGQLQSAGILTPIDPTNPGRGMTTLAVMYDKNADGTANFGQATLAGAGGTTLSNVKAGVADMDAVNVSQLKGSGLIGDDGKSIAAVTYDRNADGTPNYGSVTLGHGEGPTQLKNVADATDDGDAVNLKQLKDAGLVAPVDPANPGTGVTSLAVTYDKHADGTANFDQITLKGADGTTLSNVKAGVADMDAVNVGQLKGSGLIGEDGKSIAAVTYDRHADGTPNMESVTFGGAGAASPVALKNVAQGVAGTDAVNVDQLSDAIRGVVGPGNPLAVAYDTIALNRITLGGVGGTGGPVTITNVADGKERSDAVNYGQLSDLAAEFDEKVGGLGDRMSNLEQGSGGGSGSGTGNQYFAGTDTDPATNANAASAGTGTGNVAAGSGANIGSGANNGTAIGSSAVVSKDNGVAIGSSANASGEKSTAIGSGANAAGSNSVALGAGSTAYDDNTVSVGSIDRTRTISNVSDGVNATDVATKGQLDRAMGGMQGQVNDLSRNAYSGIAAATALTMIPGVDPGKTVSFGIGGATYKGYQAVAFGGEARITQNLKMKAGVGLSSGGNTVGVGASYQW